MKINRHETCAFIRDTAAQLAKLSTDAGLEVLSFTLSMAQLEADNQLAQINQARDRGADKAFDYGPVRTAAPAEVSA
jgi:hypothetical protein